MRLAIVGVDGSHLSERIEREIRKEIAYNLQVLKPSVVISGKSPLGGVDVIAIEIAKGLGITTQEVPPRHLHWSCGEMCYGFKRRNLDIAYVCDALLCISFQTDKAFCYHCGKPGHMLNGGCWTMKKAKELDKRAELVVVA
jgi:hypothetical protein